MDMKAKTNLQEPLVEACDRLPFGMADAFNEVFTGAHSYGLGRDRLIDRLIALYAKCRGPYDNKRPASAANIIAWLDQLGKGLEAAAAANQERITVSLGKYGFWRFTKTGGPVEAAHVTYLERGKVDRAMANYWISGFVDPWVSPNNQARAHHLAGNLYTFYKYRAAFGLDRMPPRLAERQPEELAEVFYNLVGTSVKAYADKGHASVVVWDFRQGAFAWGIKAERPGQLIVFRAGPPKPRLNVHPGVDLGLALTLGQG